MLDPRTKLVIAILFAVLVVASGKLTWLLAEWVLLLLFVISIGKIKAYLRWLVMVVPMALFFGAVTWWTVDIRTAAIAALALLILISVFFAFFCTTTPEDIGNSMVKVGLPYPIAFIFSASLQFVPVIGRKAKNVLDAQRSRGIPLEPGWKTFRHYPAFLGPLLIQAFQLAEELAEAMEARGFGRPGRTFFKVYRLRPLDWIALAAGLILLTFCLWWQRI